MFIRDNKNIETNILDYNEKEIFDIISSKTKSPEYDMEEMLIGYILQHVFFGDRHSIIFVSKTKKRSMEIHSKFLDMNQELGDVIDSQTDLSEHQYIPETLKFENGTRVSFITFSATDYLDFSLFDFVCGVNLSFKGKGYNIYYPFLSSGIKIEKGKQKLISSIKLGEKFENKDLRNWDGNDVCEILKFNIKRIEDFSWEILDKMSTKNIRAILQIHEQAIGTLIFIKNIDPEDIFNTFIDHPHLIENEKVKKSSYKLSHGQYASLMIKNPCSIKTYSHLINNMPNHILCDLFSANPHLNSFLQEEDYSSIFSLQQIGNILGNNHFGDYYFEKHLGELVENDIIKIIKYRPESIVHFDSFKFKISGPNLFQILSRQTRIHKFIKENWSIDIDTLGDMLAVMETNGLLPKNVLKEYMMDIWDLNRIVGVSERDNTIGSFKNTYLRDIKDRIKILVDDIIMKP